MADHENQDRRDDEGSVVPAGDARRPRQDYFASRGFQILVTVLFTILVLVLCATVFLSVVHKGDGVTPVVTLFGVLITGVFVFMTLRIESGARKEAQAVAQTEARFHADLAARKAAASEARSVAEIEAKNKAEGVAVTVAREVAEREFERMRGYFAQP